MSMAGDKYNREDRDILQSNLLYEAREEIKRLQRQVDRLGKDKAKLQSQLLEAKSQTSKAISDAGWERDFCRRLAEATNNEGWK